MIRWIARNIGRLEGPVKIFFSTAFFFLRVFFAVTIFALKQLFVGIAAWFDAMRKACDKTATDWTTRATMAGIGNHSPIVYGFFYLLTFVQLVVLMFVLAHLLVFTVFWIFIL